MPRLQLERPDLTHPDRLSLISQRWVGLDLDAVTYFKNLAAKDKIRYRQELLTADGEEKREDSICVRLQRPCHSYQVFACQERSKIKDEAK